MKKLLLGLILIMFTITVYAADGDILIAEQKPDVSKWSLYEVHFYIHQKTIYVDYEKQDASGNRIEEKRIVFRDREDDPSTEADETLTEFTDVITAINNGNNIKNTITNAVKAKLGI